MFYTLYIKWKNEVMLSFLTVINKMQIQEILDLQTQNLPKNITANEAKEQGFVTVQHDADLLWSMNQKYPHSIAIDNETVVGFALVMTQDFKNDIPILVPMFEQLDEMTFNNKPLNESSYFVMGQICVAKSHRGQGIAGHLYKNLEERLSSTFDYIITEVATRNWRSMRAHEKVGFQILKKYVDETTNEEWALLIWEW
jgi:ribosomal protein S18 acetylase RimI-like enzyme